MIPVSNCILSDVEKNNLINCFESTWISSRGEYIDNFESKFADYCSVKHCILVSNGTVALHAAMLALDIGPGDEVIVPDMTYVATANSVRHVGATPILVDSNIDDYSIDFNAIESAINSRTKAIIVVHLFGQMCDMAKINELAKKHNLKVVEDAAEAHGSEFNGARSGSIGDIGTFSFFGNKIITCGEGGAITTNDDELAKTLRSLINQGQSPTERFWHDRVAYNFRLTNLAASVLCGQLENIEKFITQRNLIADHYDKRLNEVEEIKPQARNKHGNSSVWLYALRVLGFDREKLNELNKLLHDAGIESRLFFHPMHALPMHSDGNSYPTASLLANEGICLPTWPGITDDQLDYICDQLIKSINTLK